MKFFSSNHAKRSTAFVMLVAWLFALASGAANACFLKKRGTDDLVGTIAGSETVIATALSVDHAKSAAGHHDLGTSKSACLKVCDDGSQFLPKHFCGLALSDPGIAPVVAVLWTAAAPAVSATRPVPEQPPSVPGQPFRTLYSRLAF